MQASPTSTTKPTWVKMFTSMRASATPAIENSRHMGTTRITASGNDQLSYWAASTRNTSTTASMNTSMAVLPVCSCSKASSVHSVCIDRKRRVCRLADVLHQLDGLAGADARGGHAVDRAAAGTCCSARSSPAR